MYTANTFVDTLSVCHLNKAMKSKLVSVFLQIIWHSKENVTLNLNRMFNFDTKLIYSKYNYTGLKEIKT